MPIDYGTLWRLAAGPVTGRTRATGERWRQSTLYLIREGKRLQGYLDRIGLRSVAGWAIGEGDAVPELTAWVNGTPVVHFRPSLTRVDIKHLARNDVGFEIDLGRRLTEHDIVGVTNEKGEHLSRSPRKQMPSEWTREDKALCLISRDMKILEIGPGYNPLTPRSQGWNSFSLDHATQDELRAKYQGERPIERIEPVDFIWKAGPLETAIPSAERNSFDALIAGHVIEHMPDPIAFFLSATSILKPGGLISLVVPDKRFSFDFFKSLTVTSDYLHAHHSRRTRHTKKTAFDNAAYNVVESGHIVWGIRALSEFNTFENDALFVAKQRFDETIEDESMPYTDYHATIYTPSSFCLIIFELGQLGVLPFEIERSFPTPGCEFYVTLRNRIPVRLSNDLIEQARLRLMKNVVRELAEQGRWLMDEP